MFLELNAQSILHHTQTNEATKDLAILSFLCASVYRNHTRLRGECFQSLETLHDLFGHELSPLFPVSLSLTSSSARGMFSDVRVCPWFVLTFWLAALREVDLTEMQIASFPSLEFHINVWDPSLKTAAVGFKEFQVVFFVFWQGQV